MAIAIPLRPGFALEIPAANATDDHLTIYFACWLEPSQPSCFFQDCSSLDLAHYCRRPIIMLGFIDTVARISEKQKHCSIL